MTKEISAFWGCVINNKFPFMEYLTKLVLKKFDIEITDLSSASCCPDPVYSKIMGKEKWLTVASRNLALAEKEKKPLMISCNGCWNTLKTASIEIKEKDNLEKINKRLNKIGYDFSGDVELTHVLTLLRDTIGFGKIESSIVRKLSGLKIATFLGCHATSPRKIAIDNPSDPRQLDDFVELLGLEPIDYDDKELCCGGPAVTLNDPTANQLLRRKLEAIKKSGADALVVICPTCFAQFDRNTAQVDKNLKIPVFHLFELIGLAIGIEPADLTFDWHRVPVEPVLKKINYEVSEKKIIEDNFVLHCLDSDCEACKHECTAAIASFNGGENEFNPLLTIQKLSEGKLIEVLESDDLWKCVNCHKCELLCPANKGLEKTFSKLRYFAEKRGIKPKVVSDKISILKGTGLGLQKISDDLREDVDLDPIVPPDEKEIKKLLSLVDEK
ncbi:MAG: heterodisulfide reductase-related iron-sulfur binding cluster [Candidatus Ranarchaeia archaeon]